VDVHVSRPGLKVIVRSGYNAPGPPDMVKARPLPVDEALDDAIASLDQRSDGRRSWTYAAVRPGALDVVAEIGLAETATGRWSRGADVELTVTRGAGET